MKSFLMAIGLGIALAEGFSAVGQYFHGRIARDGAVTFENLPPHVIFEHSTDLTNWFEVIEVKRLDGATNWGSFGYTVTDNRVFVRARTP